jgi:hypothetical protein
MIEVATTERSQNDPRLCWIANPHSATPKAQLENVQRAFM